MNTKYITSEIERGAELFVLCLRCAEIIEHKMKLNRWTITVSNAPHNEYEKFISSRKKIPSIFFFVLSTNDVILMNDEWSWSIYYYAFTIILRANVQRIIVDTSNWMASSKSKRCALYNRAFIIVLNEMFDSFEHHLPDASLRRQFEWGLTLTRILHRLYQRAAITILAHNYRKYLFFFHIHI